MAPLLYFFVTGLTVKVGFKGRQFRIPNRKDFLGLGKIPTRYRSEIQKEGVILQDEGLSIVLRYDIFKFLDYRKFLERYYYARKPHGFPYRAFSRRIAVKSPNHLKLVIQGKRNITAQMAERIGCVENISRSGLGCTIDGEFPLTPKTQLDSLSIEVQKHVILCG